MSEALATLLVSAVGLYLSIGLVVALAFAIWGAGRIDPQAREGTWGFRLLIVPGTAALWPYLAWRWWRGAPPPAEKNAHREAA